MFPAWLQLKDAQEEDNNETCARRNAAGNEKRKAKQVRYIHQIAVALLLALATGAALTSCADDDGNGGKAIAFASATAEQQVMTRANAPLAKDFVVYGYKNVSGSDKLVFGGYDVFYQVNTANTTEDNTDNYYYVTGNQTLKYWDYAASNYRFWGYVKTPGASYTPSTYTLTYDECSAAKLADLLFSKTKTVVKENFGKVVQLQFECPATKVQVRFYTSEPLSGSDNVELTEIAFAPIDATNPHIVDRGTLAVTYSPSSTTEGVVVTPAAGGVLSALNYQDITLTSANITSNTAAVALNASGAEWTLLFPHTSTAAPSAFQLTLKMDGEERTAEVPDNYMHWLPNYTYTYLFKLSNVSKKLEFVDVVIDPWTFGGVIEEEWHTW